MALDPLLLEILACPQCKGELEYREHDAQLICHACKLVYRIEDDIPVMLIDEATSLESGGPPAPRSDPGLGGSPPDTPRLEAPGTGEG